MKSSESKMIIALLCFILAQLMTYPVTEWMASIAGIIWCGCSIMAALKKQ